MSAWERMVTLHDTPPLRLSRGREPDAHATRAHHSSDATSIRGGQQHDIDAHECILCIMHRCRGKPEYGVVVPAVRVHDGTRPVSCA